MADLAIEETNRIRASLGMKPLPVPSSTSSISGPAFKQNSKTKKRSSSISSSSSDSDDPGSTLESRQAQGETNWQSLQSAADAKKAREAKLASIKKARDAAQKFAKLEGKGLGDNDEKGDLDTRTWLLQQKKRRKQIEREREKARKLEQELAEREAGLEHTAEDLKGVSVAHGLEEFDEEDGEGQVLTLKDATIDQNEEEGDELENAELKEKEATRERLGAKKRKPIYDPNAEDEDGGRKILGQYDETIDGKKRKRFQLDGKGASAEDREAMKAAVAEKMKAKPISLDVLKDDVPISDYAEPVEAKIRKAKKKKAKSTRQKAVDEDDIFPTVETNGGRTNGDSMEIDNVNGTSLPSKPKASETTSFADDDDLQASLAIQRRAALKKRKRTKPEDLARQMREEASAGPEVDMDNNQAEEGGLVIDETTEFVANLQRAKEEDPKPKPQKSKARSNTPTLKPEHSITEDVDMDAVPTNNTSDSEDLDSHLKREASSATPNPMTETGLEDEQTLNQGLGATLSMLSQRGLVAPRTEADIVGLHRDRQSFLLNKQRREAEIERRARAQRERDRASGKLDKMSAREREEYARFENKQRDQMESRIMSEVYAKDYKPDVQLKYVDEFGRSMDQKEAFKHLSHQFHGKGSGKQKTEKHLKKVEDERARDSKSLLDASGVGGGGMTGAREATAKKQRQAGVRLG
ncbi:MAG: hypothetical protein OHK93_003061 [Ramalina farinacea]|uniref:SART-1 protein n=1 Tax=Ramalina farinacea TaxID=258253 RepID=A0AA43TZE6_9LECA|nr:hypothetical protein [Ramalina farinacea]